MSNPMIRSKPASRGAERSPPGRRERVRHRWHERAHRSGTASGPPGPRSCRRQRVPVDRGVRPDRDRPRPCRPGSGRPPRRPPGSRPGRHRLDSPDRTRRARTPSLRGDRRARGDRCRVAGHGTRAGTGHAVHRPAVRRRRPPRGAGGRLPGPGVRRRLAVQPRRLRRVVGAEAANRLLAGGPATTTTARHILTFAAQYALARLWRSWGLSIGAVAGVGLGAITAAAVTGACTVSGDPAHRRPRRGDRGGPRRRRTGRPSRCGPAEQAGTVGRGVLRRHRPLHHRRRPDRLDRGAGRPVPSGLGPVEPAQRRVRAGRGRHRRPSVGGDLPAGVRARAPAGPAAAGRRRRRHPGAAGGGRRGLAGGCRGGLGGAPPAAPEPGAAADVPVRAGTVPDRRRRLPPHRSRSSPP